MMKTFTPVSWCLDSNLYEVNTRQYTPEGTFKAFSNHLSRLRNMGVETLWFMPITPIGLPKRLGTLGSYYACSDYVSINPEYGRLQDFKDLVKKAHDLGMKVIIDWVANHTGYGHTWTKTNPEFYRRDAHGHFTERNGWKDVIDLNYDEPAMRKAMVDAMQFWVEVADIDGFRCDMAHLVPLDFWVNARTALDKLKPLFWLAECDDAAYHQAFDISYAWEWMHASEKFVKDKLSWLVLEKILRKYELDFPASAMKLFFTTNHDENSWNGTEYEKYGYNALPLAVFTCTWPGLPLLYSGQELPLQKRLKFFDKDLIDWEGGYRLEGFYKKLLELRKRNPSLKNGAKHNLTLLATTGERQCCFIRSHGKKMVAVFINFHDEPVDIRIQHGMLKGRFSDVFHENQFYELHGEIHHTLLPNGFLVLEK